MLHASGCWTLADVACGHELLLALRCGSKFHTYDRRKFRSKKLHESSELHIVDKSVRLGAHRGIELWIGRGIGGFRTHWKSRDSERKLLKSGDLERNQVWKS